MKVSFDGMRKNATSSMNVLGSEIKELLEIAKDGRYFELDDFEELINSFNNSASSVDIFNCLYDDNIEGDMNDLSELISIDLINEEE